MQRFMVACGSVVTIMACAESPSPPSPPPGELVGVYAKTRVRLSGEHDDSPMPFAAPYVGILTDDPDGDTLEVEECVDVSGCIKSVYVLTQSLSWTDGAYRATTRSVRPQFQEVPPGAYLGCEFTYLATDLSVVGTTPTRLRLTTCRVSQLTTQVPPADCTAGRAFPPVDCSHPAVTESEQIN